MKENYIKSVEELANKIINYRDSDSEDSITKDDLQNTYAKCVEVVADISVFELNIIWLLRYTHLHIAVSRCLKKIYANAIERIELIDEFKKILQDT